MCNWLMGISLNKIFLVSSFLVILVLLISPVLASPYDERHIELLAVQTNGDGETIGKAADLYLELQDGSGRVFLDTTPLTNLDTQASTRYAKEMACEYFSLNCEKYDFFFTINSDTNIIGGPSAGAAAAALTAIAVMDLDHDENIAVTGTINSGGTVGPVGGVKSKIEAAAEQGLSAVLVPLSALSEEVEIDSSSSSILTDYYPESYSVYTSSPYLTLDEYASYVLGIEAFEVVDLADLLYYLTGENYSVDVGELDVNENYEEIMQGLDTTLCERSDTLHSLLQEISDIDSEIALEIESRLNDSANAREEENYYSSASACFGLNVYIHYELYYAEELDTEEFSLEVELLLENVSSLQEQVETEELLTISDLQTKMVVKERLSEAEEYLTIALIENNTYALAYAYERIISALTWMEFFTMDGKELDLGEDALQDACYAKVLEAQERYRYAVLFFSGYDIEYIGDKIQLAQDALEDENFELCLVQAAQGKAESSSIVSSLGLGTEVSGEYLQGKKEAVLRTIVRNTDENQFPILGYSYYLFASNLAEEEESLYSALLYYEYALEMSEIGIYFDDVSEEGIAENFLATIGLSVNDSSFISGFLQGLLIGLLLMWIYVHMQNKH